MDPEKPARLKFCPMISDRCQDHVGFRLGIAEVVQQQHSIMSLAVAMDQCAYVVVLGEKDAGLRGGFGQ